MIPPASKNPVRIVLTGFMGSGKSAVGPLIADQLGWRFIDVDDVIEAEAGLSVAQIFAHQGEPAFRDLERATIARLVADVNLVLALGGGAIEREDTRDLLLNSHGTLLIHLEVELRTTVARCGGTERTRPVLADQANLAARYQRRLPLYRTAHINLRADDLSPTEIAAAILELTGLRNKNTFDPPESESVAGG